MDALEPPLEYGQVYLPDGTPRPEFVADVERWRRYEPSRPPEPRAEVPEPLGVTLGRVIDSLEAQA